MGDGMEVLGGGMKVLGGRMEVLRDGMEILGELEGPSGKERWSGPASSLCCKAAVGSIPLPSLPARDAQQAAEAAPGQRLL